MPPVCEAADLNRLAESLAQFGRRQGRFLAVVSASVALLSGVFAYGSAPVYVAKARFVMERAFDPVMRDRQERPLTAAETARNIRALVISRPVIEAAIDQVRAPEAAGAASADDNPRDAVFAMLDRWGLVTLLPERERTINLWSRRLSVEVEGDLVEIQFPHTSRQFAARVANAVLDEFIKRYIGLLNAGKIAALRSDMLQSLGSEITAVRLIGSQAPASGAALRTALASRLRTLRLWLRDTNTSVRGLKSSLAAGHPRLAAEMEFASALTDAIAEGESILRRMESAGVQTHDRLEVLRVLRISYNATAQAVEQLRLAERADNRTANIRIVEYAEQPPTPEGDKALRIVLAVLLAPLFAVAAGIVRDNLFPAAAADPARSTADWHSLEPGKGGAVGPSAPINP